MKYSFIALTILVLCTSIKADYDSDCRAGCEMSYQEELSRCAENDQYCQHAAAGLQRGCLEMCRHALTEQNQATQFEQCQQKCQVSLGECSNKCTTLECVKQCNTPFVQCDDQCRREENLRRYDETCKGNCENKHTQCVSTCKSDDKECLGACNGQLMGCAESCRHALRAEAPSQFEQCQQKCQVSLGDCSNKCTNMECVQKCNAPFVQCDDNCRREENIRRFDVSCRGNCQLKHNNCLSLCKPGDKQCQGACDGEYMGCGETCRHVLRAEAPAATQFEQCQQKCQVTLGDCSNKCTTLECVQKCNEPFAQCDEQCRKEENLRRYDQVCLGNCQTKHTQCVSVCKPNDKECLGACEGQLTGCGESCRHQLKAGTQLKMSTNEQCKYKCYNTRIYCAMNCGQIIPCCKNCMATEELCNQDCDRQQQY